MVEITPGLLLGGMGDVLSLLGSYRPSHKVTRLLSILSNPIDWSEVKTSQGSLMAKYVSAPDIPSSDLLSHFPACVQFIDDCILEGGVVLVHCEHGISRSATMVLAFLMKKQKMSFQKALAFVSDRKPDIRPNPGFQEQLKLWEMMRYELDDNCKPYRAYVLHQQAQSMKRNGYMESMQLFPNPSSGKDATYKCRKCRHALLTSESVLWHEQGNGDLAFPRHHHGSSSTSYFVVSDNARSKVRGKQTSQTQPATSVSLTGDAIIPTNTSVSGTDEGASNLELLVEDVPGDSSPTESTVMAELSALRTRVSALKIEVPCDVVCSSLFVEPVEWMGPFILGHKDGKLLCPKCSSRIGSFDWSGSQCSCGKWVTPAFKIVKSKLDFVNVIM